MMTCESADMHFIRHQGKVEYARELQTWFRDSVNIEHEIADVSQC